MLKKTVCIDMDGVLAEYSGWQGIFHIGDPIDGARDFVDELAKDFKIMIYSTRCNIEVNKAEGDQETLLAIVREWLQMNAFKYDSIQIGKPLAVAYIDDKAVSCRPQEIDCAFDDALHDVRKLHDGK